MTAAPLVGRENTAALAGRGQLVLGSGETGIGTTALVNEFLVQAVERAPNAAVLSAPTDAGRQGGCQHAESGGSRASQFKGQWANGMMPHLSWSAALAFALTEPRSPAPHASV